LEVTGLFVAIGHDPNTAPLKSVLALDAEGFIVADARCRTSVPGIFAAGDVADRYYKQAVTAAGTGCAAALEAERYISGH
jgi:thioredoxin reductase (NADPH)